MNIQLMDIWTVAGVLLGFQVTSFMWRIDREVKIRDAELQTHGGKTYLTPSDFVNIISMIVIVVGVFVLPILVPALTNPIFLKDAFGLAALLFIGHAFARAGHYRMYSYALYALRHTLAKILGKDPHEYNSNPPAPKSGGLDPRYFPRQEQMVVGIVITVAFAYLIVAFILR